MKIGVLAVQGAFIEQEIMLKKLGADCVEIRQKEQLAGIDGIVLPGGESTVQGQLLRKLDMLNPLKDMIKYGLPVLATCAGLILLSETIENDSLSHIGTLPVVMVSPGDIALVSESGEERRRLSNAVLSQMDREYLAAVQCYNRLLAQRNRMLKEAAPDQALLAVIDERMLAPAASIHEARARLAEELRPVVADYYRLISGGGEEVSIEYKSDLSNASLIDVFAAHREQDFRLRYTSSGVQRDDFLFAMNGHPIRRAGSQGQQKSFLVALKFAQYEIMKRSYGFAPMLLLDDVFDKLDLDRISNLIGMVAGADFGQIFITDTDSARLSGIVDRMTDDRAYFKASAGEFTKM